MYHFKPVTKSLILPMFFVYLFFKGGYLFWKARVGASAAKSTESEKYLNIVLTLKTTCKNRNILLYRFYKIIKF